MLRGEPDAVKGARREGIAREARRDRRRLELLLREARMNVK